MTIIKWRKLAGGRFNADNLDAFLDMIVNIWGDNPPLHRISVPELSEEELIDQLKARWQ